MSTATSQKPSAGIVAIIDDNPRNRERLADFVKSMHFEPLVFSDRLASVSTLIQSAQAGGATYAICDHRLFEEGHYATFFGAEAVAGFYDSHKIAPLLVTGYENADSETSIRIHRRKIPALLHSTEVSLETLKHGLLFAQQEAIGGLFSPEREPCPAIMTVTDVVSSRTKDKIVRVIITQWDPHTDVGFPLTMVQPEIREAIQPGAFLYADVNVGARRAEDLYFINFSLPNPNDVRAAATIFNNP